MADGAFDEADAVDIGLEPGQMSLHEWLFKGVDTCGLNDFDLGHAA